VEPASFGIVSNFIDLIGASGTAYRFRRPDGAVSAIGGNFVYVRDQDGEARVVCCGCARSLGWALSHPVWFSDENAAEDDQLYVRLNAIRAVRTSEHQDLVAALPRPFTIYEIE
jgi:hypothetical protein